MCNAARLWLEKLTNTSSRAIHLGDTTVAAAANNTVGFEVYVADTTSTRDGPQNETSATQALLARGAQVLVAPYSSTLTPGAALAALQAPGGAVPVVSFGAASETVFRCPSTSLGEYPPCVVANRRRFNNLFSVITPGPEYFTSVVELLNTYGVREMGVVYENAAATRSYALGAITRAYDLGKNISIEIEVVKDINVASPVITNGATLGKGYIQKTVTAKDDAAAFAEVVTILKALQDDIGVRLPEMLTGGTYYDACIEFVKALVAKALFPKALAVTSCAGDSRVHDALGEKVRWVIGPTQWDRRLAGTDYDESQLRFPAFTSSQGRPAPQVFNDLWTSTFGQQPNYQAAGSMAAMTMLGEAVGHIAVGETVNSATITRELGKVFANSFYGKLSTNHFGVNDRRAMSVYQYDVKAEVQLVAPISAATARLSYPAPGITSNARNAPCGVGNQVVGANRMCSDAESAHMAKNADKTSSTWALLGHEWCNTTCIPCPVGTYSNDLTGTTQCIPCPNNTVAPSQGSNTCQLCHAGFTHNSNRTACEPCPPGTARDADDSICKPCGPGTFASKSGQSICLSCDFDGGGYASTSNNTACLACPANTERLLGSAGMFVTECLCKNGFYQRDKKPSGAACEPCTVEAVCLGFTKNTTNNTGGSGDHINAAPYPKTDYWGFKEDILGAPTGEMPMMWPCSAGRCLGGPDFLCSDAYEGAMCANCADGYFSVGSECYKCLDDGGIQDVAVYIISAVGVISLWVGMNTVVAGGYDAFDITLIFLQVLSTVQSFQLKWPESLTILSQAASLVNFDLDFIAPNCLTKWQYIHRTILTLFLPLVLMFAAFVSVLWKARSILKESGSHPGIKHSLKIIWASLATPGKFLAQKTYDDGLNLNWERREELNTMVDDRISKLISFLVVVYNNLCLKSFGSFYCVERGAGKGSYLYQDPNISCWDDPEHHFLVTISIISIIIYVIGIPTTVTLVLRSARRNNSLYTPESINRFGFLYCRYETNNHLWEVTFLIRRFVVSIVYIYAGASEPYIAVLMVMVSLGLNLCISSAFMPFKEDRVDLIDLFGQLCIMLYLLAGVVADTHPEHSEGLGIMLNVFVWGVIVYCMHTTILETHRARLARKYAKRIRRRILEVRKMDLANEDEVNTMAQDFGPHLVKGKVALTMKMTCRSLMSSFRGLRDEGYVRVSYGQISEWLIKHGERYIHPEHPCFHILRKAIGIDDGENFPVARSIVALEEDVQNFSVENRLFYDGEGMAGELSRTLRPDLLRVLATNDKTSIESIARLLSLSVAMQNVLGDNCAIGAYSHYPEAIILKKITSVIPALVDYAVTCSEAEADALRTTFVGLCRISFVRGTSGFLAPLCVQEDHAPMLYWLLLADKYDRQLLRVFLEEVEIGSVESVNKDVAKELDEERRADRNAPYSSSSKGFAGYGKQTTGLRRLASGLIERANNQMDDLVEPRIASVDGQLMPASRVEGYTQAAEFKKTGFRIFSAMGTEMNRGNSRRFEHGLGQQNFDEEDVQVPEIIGVDLNELELETHRL